MENVDIVEKVPLNEPADWVSSLVYVDKPDGSIRVCLDPKDLNVAMKREHYPLPVVDDITTTVSVKIVGTLLCVLLPSMLVYTICRLNGNKQHWEGKGKHGKGKNGFCVNCPNYFCLGLCQRGI